MRKVNVLAEKLKVIQSMSLLIFTFVEKHVIFTQAIRQNIYSFPMNVLLFLLHFIFKHIKTKTIVNHKVNIF